MKHCEADLKWMADRWRADGEGLEERADLRLSLDSQKRLLYGFRAGFYVGFGGG